MPMRKLVLFAATLVLAACAGKPLSTTVSVPANVNRAEATLYSFGLVDVRTYNSNILVSLAYATTNNPLGTVMYGQLTNCFLQPDAAAMLTNAEAILEKRKPGYHLYVYDGARPETVQKLLWEKVSGSRNEVYVERPGPDALHTYGCSVDVTIAGKNGVPIDMISDYGLYDDISQPHFENDFLAARLITGQQYDNRQLLREVMTAAGFVQSPVKWWQFDAASEMEVSKKYKVIP